MIIDECEKCPMFVRCGDGDDFRCECPYHPLRLLEALEMIMRCLDGRFGPVTAKGAYIIAKEAIKSAGETE